MRASQPIPARLVPQRIRAHARASWTVFRRVNLRQLTQRRRRAALTVLGIATSVSLVVAITLVNATVRGTVGATASGLAGAARFEVRPVGPRSFTPALLRRARAAPGVRALVPMTQQVTRMRHGRASARVLVAGTPPDVALLFPAGFDAATRQVTHPRPGTIALSPRAAQSLGVRPGDRVSASTPRGSAALRVAAVLPASALSSVNGGELALAGLADTQRTFDRGSTLDILYALARGGSSRALQRTLGRSVLVGNPGASAQPYEHTFDGIATTTQQIRGVALLVALFLVLNTMAMSLAERRRDIALIATNGAQLSQIVAAFVAEAALLGAAGGALGTGAGWALAHGLVRRAEHVYQSVLPITATGSVHLTAAQALLGVGSGAAVAMAAAAIAARRIVRMRPIEALGPAPAYAPAPAPGRRSLRSRGLAASGLATVACAGLVVWRAPVGSHPALLGLVLALTLAGALQLLPFLVGALGAGSARAWPRLFGLRGRLAADGLVRAPGRTTVTAGALALTTALVVATASGLGSFKREVDRAAGSWYTSPLYVRANGEGLLASDQPLQASLGRRLERIPGVRAAYPMRVLLLERDARQLGILAWPIATAARRGDQITGDVPIADRRMIAAVRRGEVVISRLTARRHHLAVGDVAHFPSVRGVRSFRVAGVFNDLASADAFYIEYATYRRLSADTKADRFALELAPGADPHAVAARVQRYLDARRLPGTVVTSREMAGYVLDLVRGVFSLASGAQVAALLIAALVVLNTMLTVTFERRRELGVQRMLGMTDRQLSGAVVLEAVAIAAVGAAIAVLVGLMLGFVMTVGIENQLAWHVVFRPAPGSTLAAALIAVALGAAAAAYPSWLATRPALIELLAAE
jgi:putative ABC transport system permease protein